MVFSDYKMNLTIKACCLFEKMVGKSFYVCNTENDLLHLLYAMLVANNNTFITYDTFISMLENKKAQLWLGNEYKKIEKYLSQFIQTSKSVVESSGQTKDLTITQIATSLIIQHHMDAHYVMEEMQLWELESYFEMADEVKKMEDVEKRFWAFMMIRPQVDGRKLRKPEQLVQFSWEKETHKNKVEMDLKKKEEQIKAFFAKQEKRIEYGKE